MVKPIPVTIPSLSVELTNRAFSGTSFSPEKRVCEKWIPHRASGGFGSVLRKTTTQRLQNVQTAFIEAFNAIADRYASMTNAYLAAHSRVMSSMITGPARFPVESNRKKIDTADNRANEANDYLRKTRRGLRRRYAARWTIPFRLCLMTSIRDYPSEKRRRRNTRRSMQRCVRTTTQH